MSETKQVAAICSSCGALWSDRAFTEGCEECGGGAMQRPCPLCSGTCGKYWRRAVIDSNTTKTAHWIGYCRHLAQDDHAPAHKFVFRFGYLSPGDMAQNAGDNLDGQSSFALFIRADSEREATWLGRIFADVFVQEMCRQAEGRIASRDSYVWSQSSFAYWIEEDETELNYFEAHTADFPSLERPDQIVPLVMSLD